MLLGLSLTMGWPVYAEAGQQSSRNNCSLPLKAGPKAALPPKT